MTTYTHIRDNDEGFTVTLKSNGGRLNTAGVTKVEVEIGNTTFDSTVDTTVVSVNDVGDVELTLGNSVPAGTYNVIMSVFDNASTLGTVVVHPKLPDANLKLIVKEK